MSLLRLALLYALFGAVATALNLAAQAAAHALAPEAARLGRTALGLDLALLRAFETPLQGAGPVYWGALAFGTGVGLVAKYVLDKRWVFDDRSVGAGAHGRRFSLYTLMGVVTTVVFWGTQTAFFVLSGDERMLYLGGAIGLAIGYVIKYRLDKRFVFTPALREADGPGAQAA